MKLPSNANRVFKGILFDVYQYEEKLYDGSTATFEMLKRTAAMQVVPTIGNRIVVIEDEQPNRPKAWTLAGGRQDGDENPLDGAKRELLEETGLASKDWTLYKEFQPYWKIDWSIYLYIARNCEKVQEPKPDPGERITLHEVSFDEFVEIATSEGFLATGLSLDILRAKTSDTLDEFKNKFFPK